MRTVIFLIGFAAALFFGSLVAPILIGLAFGEKVAVIRLSVLASTGAFVSIVTTAATLGYRHVLTPNRLILSMVVVWAIVSLIGATPFVLVLDMEFGRALFESVSGLTTTGASTLVAREAMPQSMLFWRLQLEWIGGFMTLASLFLVLSPLAVGGLPRRAMASEWRADLSDDRDGGVEHLKRYTPLLAAYVGVSVAVFLAYIASGADTLGAAHLTMTSVSTGGFNPNETELESHYGPATLVVMAFVMALAATSVFWQRYDLSNPLRVIWRNREAWWVGGFIAALTLLYVLAFRSVGGLRNVQDFGGVLAESFFAAASVVATSGHEMRPGVIALLPEILVFSVAFLGAAVFSTASGLKIHRLGAMLVQSRRELNLLIYPSSITPTRIARADYDERSIVETWPVLILTLVVLAVGIFLLAGGSGTFESAMLSAMALLVNAGPLYEAYIPAAALPELWPGYRDFTAFERYAGCAIMLLGRLEFIAVFAILNLKYWLSR
ncbi:TrkH family potassium uptake protein [Oricola thermophila]|uniref:TrkH family potassium uptake protein n=1 Tax=Oricola thermophila TaxID=2742145 RepID=A0A6N1VB76_9HYPH|nr:TrkH family potassium uptake protein [Oricola thermophila]QKV18170.1 TrkH family potassium uptake protein [Oricola thermophila]